MRVRTRAPRVPHLCWRRVARTTRRRPRLRVRSAAFLLGAALRLRVKAGRRVRQRGRCCCKEAAARQAATRACDRKSKQARSGARRCSFSARARAPTPRARSCCRRAYHLEQLTARAAAVSQKVVSNSTRCPPGVTTPQRCRDARGPHAPHARRARRARNWPLRPFAKAGGQPAAGHQLGTFVRSARRVSGSHACNAAHAWVVRQPAATRAEAYGARARRGSTEASWPRLFGLGQSAARARSKATHRRAAPETELRRGRGTLRVRARPLRPEIVATSKSCPNDPTPRRARRVQQARAHAPPGGFSCSVAVVQGRPAKAQGRGETGLAEQNIGSFDTRFGQSVVWLAAAESCTTHSSWQRRHGPSFTAGL